MSYQCYVLVPKFWGRDKFNPEQFRCGNKYHKCPNCGARTRDTIGVVTCRCRECFWAFTHWPPPTGNKS